MAEEPSAEPWLAAPSPATVDHEVDARGLLCPLPLVHLSKALREADAGEVVEVVATDPGFFPDLLRWIRVRSAELVALRQRESGADPELVAWVRVGG